MASETGKGDLSELKPKCENDKFICAQRMFYTVDYLKDNTQFIECTNKPNKTKCYTPDSSVDEFFNIIDPEKLYNSFNSNKVTESIMKDFITELNEKLNQNKDVKEKLISAYKSDIESLGIDITTLDHNNILREYIPIQPENGDQESCHDIIGNVCLNTTPKSNSIFHISIHPKTSKYVIDKNKGGKKIGSCGYYKKHDKKPDTEGSVPDTEGSGSFHYKIDNILDPLNMDKSFKKFINAADGTFTENLDEFKRKGNKETDTTNATLYELHKFFYEEFRKFWNSKIVPNPKFRMTTSKVPEPEPEGLAQVPDVPLVPQKRGSQQGSLIDPSEATDGLQPERQRSRKNPDQSPEILGGDKRIRRKTNKKRKTIKKRKINKKRKTKKRKTIKRIPIKKRKTSKR